MWSFWGCVPQWLDARGPAQPRRRGAGLPSSGTPGALPERPAPDLAGILSRIVVPFLAPILLVLLCLMAMNAARFGDPWQFNPTIARHGMSLLSLPLGLYGYCFSLGRSIFLYSPPTILALYALVPMYRRFRAEVVLILSLAGIYLLLYSSYGDWGGGWCWGPRYMMALTPFLILPLNYLLDSRAGKAAVACFAFAGFGVQALGAVINYDFVYWDWSYLKPNPIDANLFTVELSPISTNLHDLLANRNIDLWLVEVGKLFGAGVLLATLAVPAALFAGAVVLLRGQLREVRNAPQDVESAASVSDTGGEFGACMEAGARDNMPESAVLDPPVEAVAAGAQPRQTARKPLPAAGFRIKAGIYALFLSLYLLTAGGHFFSTDHIAVYLTTEDLIDHHSLSIKHIYNAVPGLHGQYYSAYGLGQSLVDIPLYLIGKGVDSIGSPAMHRYFGGVYLGDWGGTVPIFFVSLLNQLVMPLNCVMVFLFGVRLGFSPRRAFATTLLFGLCTFAIVYARDSFQHPLETLFVLLCVYILFVHRSAPTAAHALYAGTFLALGLLTRLSVVVLVPPIAVYLLFIGWRALLPAPLQPATPRASRLSFSGQARGMWRACWTALPRYLAPFMVPIALVLALTVGLNVARFGDPWLFNGPAEGHGFSLSALTVGLYGNLFTVGRSIFLYSPPLLLALFTFRQFLRSFRAEALLFLSMAAAYLLFYSGYTDWSGGWSWGPRYLLAVTPFLILPASYALGSRTGRALVVCCAVVGFGVQILGVTINYDYVYSNWTSMNLNPADAFLYMPEISAIPTHLHDLLANRDVDLWLIEVYQQFGFGMLLLTLAVPGALMTAAVALLGGIRAGSLLVWRDV